MTDKITTNESPRPVISTLRAKYALTKQKFANSCREWQESRRAWRNERTQEAASKVRRYVRERVNAFERLKGIDTSTRHTLKPQIIHYEAQVALHEYLTVRITAIVAVISSILLFCLLIKAPEWMITQMSVTFGWFWSGIVPIASLVLSAAYVLILIGILLTVHFLGGGNKLIIFVAALCFVQYGYAYYQLFSTLSPGPQSVNTVILALGMTQFLLFFLGCTFILIIMRPIAYVVLYSRKRKISDAIFVDRVLSALETAASPEGIWKEIRMRNKLMAELEWAAQAAEGLPSALRSFDQHTEVWKRQRFAEIGASLRAKKQWVCMPKVDTQGYLEAALTRCFIDAAFGRWDSLETAEGRLTRREILLKARSILQTILIAVIPAALVFGAKHYGILKDSSPFDQPLSIATLIWAMVCISAAVDPNFSDNLKLFKKVGSSISSFSMKAK